MKKICIILLTTMIIFLLIGCSGDIELTEEEITNNTLVLHEDGSLQVAIIDLFDKEYYDFEEFKDFINEEVGEYNGEHTEDSIVVDIISQADNKVVLILTYKGIEDYTVFNGVSGFWIDANTASQGYTKLPETLVNKRGDIISRAEALDDDKYKVFAINEEMKIIIDGKILYYYNGNYIDSKTLESDKDEMTYIIYKDTFF